MRKGTKKPVPTERDKVMSDLLDQLERNGTVGQYYTSLVGDYMTLWDVRGELYSDIKTRGSKIEKFDSRGNFQLMNNESIEQSIKVSGQMLKILDNLGIRPVEAESSGKGDDEM